MHPQPCVNPSRRGTSPVWRLIFIIVLLLFAIAAQTLGMTTEVIVLLITAVTTAALQLSGIQLTKPLTFTATEPRQAQ